MQKITSSLRQGILCTITRAVIIENGKTISPKDNFVDYEETAPKHQIT